MRLTVLSNDRLNPSVNWTLLSPSLMAELTEAFGATVMSPPRISWARRKEWVTAISGAARADTLFWMQSSSRPELPVHVLSAINPLARRSAFVVDAWKPQLKKIGLLAVVQHLNPCFVAFREGQRELQRLFPAGQFEWLPFGVDTDIFNAPVGGSRPVFAFWMGRRYEPLHQALLRYCDARGLRYEYRKGGNLTPAELGRLTGQARYFVVTPPDLDNPARTGGFSPLMMRYMEGLSAGARLLGVLPTSGEFEDLLPLDCICRVAADGSDLATKLDADNETKEGWLAVAQARDLVRRHHSWKRRALQIHQRLSSNRPIAPGKD